MAKAAPAAYPVDVIAKVLMLTPRRVQQLAREGVIPRADRGRYSLVGSVHGYIRFLQDQAAGRDTAPTAIRERDTIAAARIKEARAAILESRYVDREELVELATRMGVELAAELDGVAGRVAEQVVAVTGGDRASVQALLFTEHRRIRAGMAKAVEELCNADRPQ